MQLISAHRQRSRVGRLALFAGAGIVLALATGSRGTRAAEPASAMPTVDQAGPDGPPTQMLVATGEGADGQAAQAIVSYFQTTYGIAGFKPPWFDTLLEINVLSGAVTAVTSIFDDDAGVVLAAQVCNALAGYIYSPDAAGAFLTQIQVFGSDGAVLAARNSPITPC